MSSFPNFLILGAAKTGTTSLYHYLRKHPEIFMCPKKEPNFFAFHGKLPPIKGEGNKNKLKHFLYCNTVLVREDYQALFLGAASKKVAGEASCRYLYFHQSAIRIHDYNPKMKLIFILRDPIERAYSHFRMMKSRGFEPFSFEDALAAEDHRVKERWVWDYHYKRLGLYYCQLKVYLDLFPEEQIKLCFYDSWQQNTENVLQEIFSFLNVDCDFPIELQKGYNVAESNYWSEPGSLLANLKKFRSLKRLTKFRGIRVIVNRMEAIFKKPFISPSPALRKRYRFFFEEDIRQLEKHTGRSLGHWLE